MQNVTVPLSSGRAVLYNFFVGLRCERLVFMYNYGAFENSSTETRQHVGVAVANEAL